MPHRKYNSYTSNKKSRILIKQRRYMKTMAIIKLVRVALDKAVYKLSFDTKFEDFVEGLVHGCTFVKFKSMYKYMYLLSKLWKIHPFSVENPSLFTTRSITRY